MKPDKQKDPNPGNRPEDKGPPDVPPGQDKDKGPKPDKKVDLIVVVNGQPVEVKAKVDEPLAEVRDAALKKGNVVGQPPENWELKDEAGNVLDLATPVGELGFEDGTTLFLSLKAGVAGV